MAEGKAAATSPAGGMAGVMPRIVGSLREALAAADRADGCKKEGQGMADENPSAGGEKGGTNAEVEAELAAAVREARGSGARPAEKSGAKPPPLSPAAAADAPRLEAAAEGPAREAEATTRLHRAGRPGGGGRAPTAATEGEAARTRLVRGRNKVTRAEFHQDPVVGWLVVVGGPGLGAFRPIFEGNNTVGRAGSQRIPIDFGDDTISAEEQAYIRYDSVDRSFLLVPNLAKTNIVSVNDRKPTAAVSLAAMDVITMGRTQLVFVPFCGEEFDWAELSEAKD
jgi:hypothetical protein